MTTGRVRVGIGGWVFEPWRGSFYPDGLPKARELAHASRQVTTIEINATFYRTQSRQSFERWAAETPDDFVFAVKANRFAVNRKDLADGHDAIDRFVESGITVLGDKLGPLLWQLAGTKKFNPAEIEGFLSNLPEQVDGRRLRHVIEPRHASFMTADFVALARRYGVAICLAESSEYPMIADPTAAFCYLRLQTSSSDHAEGYDRDAITSWAQRIMELAKGGLPTGLPLIEAANETSGPRDCFVYLIAGAKERNPAGAIALQAALRWETNGRGPSPAG